MKRLVRNTEINSARPEEGRSICPSMRSTLAAYVIVSFAAGIALAGDPSPRPASPATQGQGIFSGTYENGLPLYRFPAINVTVNRKAELARMEREERLARASLARHAGTVTRATRDPAPFAPPPIGLKTDDLAVAGR